MSVLHGVSFQNCELNLQSVEQKILLLLSCWLVLQYVPTKLS